MTSQKAAELPSSRLSQMRMRFQQKTQEEQEQRRQELNLSTGNAQQPRAVTSRIIGNGKVRQMFDERRRGAGIDRSNPLKPIGDTRAQPTQPQQQQQQLVKNMSTMSLKEKSFSDSNNNNSGGGGGGSKYNTLNSNRLKPVITRKTPPVRLENQLNANISPQSSARSMKTSTAAAPVRTSPQDKPRQTTPQLRQVKPKSPVTNNKMSQPPPAGTSLCRYCGRHFNTDRLGKHETVCQRTMNTKRRIFDASKQRVKGTESEKYNKQRQKQPAARGQATYSSAAQQQGLNTGVKSNWRRKHEEFIQAIRAAKQVQAHLARGGKLSDLPPPPPSENPDYIQCPHCNRRFNQQAAERHIPRCATMIHNKPRRSNPQVKKR